MTDQIIRALLEADDEADWKDAVASAETAPWPEHYAQEHYLYDEQGRVVRKSRNLRGIREYVSRMPVSHVMIQELDRGEGGIKVMFQNNWYWTGRFACFGVLKWALRNWRNLYGAPLTVNGQPGGLVGYRNAALIEAREPEDFDPKELYDQPQEYSLDDMKRAEPGFFDRSNTRFFGTKKIYKYGNFIVLKNVRRMPGWFGGTTLSTSYVIYEFVHTPDNPQGFLLHRQSTNELAKAKSMIKRRDFREWREQLADYGTGVWRNESLDDDEETTKELLGGHLTLVPRIQAELAKGVWREAGSHHYVFPLNDHMNVLVTQLDDDLWELRTTFDSMELVRRTGTEEEILAILEQEGYLEGGGLFNREEEYRSRVRESDEDDITWKDVTDHDRDWVFRYEWIPNGKGYKLSVYFNKKFVGGEWLRTRNRSRLKWVEKQVREKDAVEPFSLERHKNIWNWLDMSQIESVTRELQPVWMRLLDIE